MVRIPESALKKIEKEHADGITSADLLQLLASHDVRFGEATLRKWVQLGLLPRSIRVGSKGKHQGSKGKYPIRVVRQIVRIKELMARDVTIEEIQRQFLFVRGEIEALEQTLANIFARLEGHVAITRPVSAEITRARTAATDLVDRLEKIERRLMGEETASTPEVVAS
jgi:hypothetical protein